MLRGVQDLPALLATGIRDFTFEASSGFTHVYATWRCSTAFERPLSPSFGQPVTRRSPLVSDHYQDAVILASEYGPR
jgi:hypothetical protein